MLRAHDPRLLSLFLNGLAVAAAACSPATSAPETPTETVDVTPTPNTSVATAATTTTPPETPPVDATDLEPAAYTRLFTPVGPLAKAFPADVKLEGFVDILDTNNNQVVCSTSPCPTAWKALVPGDDEHYAIISRAGKLEAMTLERFPDVIGKVDTAEKAALRVRLDDYRAPGSCDDVIRAGFECAGRASGQAPAIRKTESGFEVMTYGSRDVCGGSAIGRTVALGIAHVDLDGELDEVSNTFTRAIDERVVAKVECHYPTRGRMFEGFVDLPPEACELDYYVRAHRHEAAAVFAFERLARELAAHGAPLGLVEAARTSAIDEARHAALFRERAEALATRLGVSCDLGVPAPAYDEAPRDLLPILMENAEEGCANETYAALVATYQASFAPSASMRAVMTEIAADERAHAALAAAVHAWGRGVLEPEAARLLEARRREALCVLARGAARSDAATALGEPPPEVARLALGLVARALDEAA